jgi:hypothetical protein
MRHSKLLQCTLEIAERLNRGERVAIPDTNMATTIINWYKNFGTEINYEVSEDGKMTVLWK